MDIQAIPLSKLKASAANVRKTGGKKVDDLVASIAAHGLRQNLTVVEVGKGFEVVAGGRRLRALQQLAKAGTLPAGLVDGVPCMVVDADAAAEISLAENTIREAMHPIDQFAAFQAMADADASPADIAARFGVSELVVKQRMRLARISPKLLKAYGDGEMKLDQLQAFAVSDDHAQQEATWKRSKGNGYESRPEEIRRELSRKQVGTDDARVQLVGLEAYEAAGGELRRDLFSSAVFVADVPLLERLVAPALARTAEQVKAEGWSWVEVRDTTPSWDERRRRVEPDDEREADPKDAAEYDELEALAWDEMTPAQRLRYSELEDGFFTPEQYAAAGAVVCLEHNGVTVYRGLLRDGAEAPEVEGDEDRENEDERGVASTARRIVAEVSKPEKDPTAIPAGQVFNLTTLRTGELALAMIGDPQKAVIALTAHLAEDWRKEYGVSESGIGMHHKVGANVPEQFLAAEAMWEKRLAFKGPVLEWLAGQPWDTVVVLLAFLTARSLDVVQRYPNQKGLGDELCAYFQVDMARRWRPDAEFLQKIPAAAILQALRESGIKDVEQLAKLKKAELAGRAADLLRDKIWVPECLRLPALKAEAKPKAAHGKSAATGDA